MLRSSPLRRVPGDLMGQSLTQSLIPPPLKVDALARRCYEEQLIPDRLGVVRRSALLGAPDDPLVVADHRAWPSAFSTASIIARSLVARGRSPDAVRMMTAAQPPLPV